jgi:translation initiation factor 5
LKTIAKLDEFADFVEEQLTTASPDTLSDLVVSKATELGLSNSKVCAILPHLLFTDDLLATSQIASRAPLIARFSNTPSSSVSESSLVKAQRALLGGLERFIVSTPERKKALLPKMALVLKALYDAEVVEEEACLAWGEKHSKKFVDKKTAREVREHAEKFLTWLKEADEDEDEDED